MDEKLLEIFQKNKEVAFATSVDGRPHLRIFQIMKIDGNDIYFATSPKKMSMHSFRQIPMWRLLT